MSTLEQSGKVIPSHVPEHLVVDFDIYKTPNEAEDVFWGWKYLHEEGTPELVWSPYNTGHWIATRGDLIFEMYKDDERFSSAKKDVPRRPDDMLKFLPFEADAPLHQAYRAPLLSFFNPKAIDNIMVNARSWAIELIDGFTDNGECEFVADFALKMPIGVVMDLLDFPWDDRDDLIAYTETGLRNPDQEKRLAAQGATIAYVQNKLEERRTKPGSDIISYLMQADILGRPITDEEILGIAVNLTFGGLDTVTSTLGFITKFLAENPEYQSGYRSDPELAATSVDELLRRFSVSNPGRTVAYDMEYNGVQLKKGDIIILPGGLHGMDERAFENAMTVNFDRPRTISSVFGNGAHRCLGSYLARSEIRMFLEEWFKRIPTFRIREGEKAVTVSGMVNGVEYLPLVWSL